MYLPFSRWLPEEQYFCAQGIYCSWGSVKTSLQCLSSSHYPQSWSQITLQRKLIPNSCHFLKIYYYSNCMATGDWNVNCLVHHNFQVQCLHQCCIPSFFNRTRQDVLELLQELTASFSCQQTTMASDMGMFIIISRSLQLLHQSGCSVSPFYRNTLTTL